MRTMKYVQYFGFSHLLMLNLYGKSIAKILFCACCALVKLGRFGHAYTCIYVPSTGSPGKIVWINGPVYQLIMGQFQGT